MPLRPRRRSYRFTGHNGFKVCVSRQFVSCIFNAFPMLFQTRLEFGETLMQRLEPAQEICEEPNGEVFITEIVDPRISDAAGGRNCELVINLRQILEEPRSDGLHRRELRVSALLKYPMIVFEHGPYVDAVLGKESDLITRNPAPLEATVVLLDDILAQVTAEHLGGKLGLVRNRMDFTMQDHAIELAHSREMCTEIGERLREILARDQTMAPASIENRLNRLRELDEDDLPSIVPPIPH
jgi:hypothetical protein